MTRTCWRAAADGRYWIDCLLGTLPCQLMLDTGIVDRANQIAFEVDPAIYDSLDQSGQLLAAGRQPRRDSSGRTHWLPAGFIVARLRDPTSGASVGPQVRCLVPRNYAGVPSRVGIVFFHRLTGCCADWDFDYRLWCVECP